MLATDRRLHGVGTFVGVGNRERDREVLLRRGGGGEDEAAAKGDDNNAQGTGFHGVLLLDWSSLTMRRPPASCLSDATAKAER